MAKAFMTSSLNGIGGSIDKYTFRRRGSKVFVGARRGKSTTPPTAAQEAQHERFSAAARYAKSALAKPELRARYNAVAKERESIAFAVAVRDWFKAPEVTAIVLATYHGFAGELIKVSAHDDIDVVAVEIQIRLADGTVLEEGEAVLLEGDYVYTATTTLPAGTPVIIEAVAIDRPGNEGKLTLPFQR